MRIPLFVSVQKYFLLNIISGIFPFLMLPILTRYLLPEDFGHLAIYTTLSAIVSAFFTMGVNGAIGRVYFEQSKADFTKFIGTCLVLITLSSVVVSTLILSALIFTNMDINLKWLWFWTVTVTAFAQAFFAVGLAVFQVENKVRLFAVTQISQATLLALLTIIMVVGLSWDWRGRILAQAIATCLTAIGVLFYLVHHQGVSFKIEVKFLRSALRYSLPLMVHVISGIAISMADRLIIARQLNLSEAGLYMVASQVTVVLAYLIDAINRAYSPWLFKVLASGESEIRLKVVKGTYIFFLIILIIAVTYAQLVIKFMDMFLGNSYSGSGIYIFLLSIASSLMGMYYMVTLYIQYAKRTEYLALITLIVGLINIISCYYFVMVWGGIGAAYSSVLSQACMFVFTWLMAIRLVKMPWKYLA